MRWIDRIFTRRRERARHESLRPRTRSRLVLACRELSDAEKAVQERMNLCVRPRLALVDEESARVITPQFREEIELEHLTSAEPR